MPSPSVCDLHNVSLVHSKSSSYIGLYFDKEIDSVAVVGNNHPAPHSPNVHCQFLAVGRRVQLPIEGEERVENFVTTVDQDRVHS